MMRHARMAALAGAVLGLAGAAQAVVNTVALYRCGEDGDDPNVALVAAVGTDAAIIYNNTESIVTGTTGATGSTKYLDNYRSVWSPNVTYLSGQAANWGMCAWVLMPSGPLDGSTYVGDAYWMMSNGNFNTNALGLSRPGGVTTWNIGHGDIVPVDSALYGTWAHVALVYNGDNNAQLWVNGELLGARQVNASFRNDTYGYFYIGTWNYNNNVGRAAKGFDDILVFDFQAGAFDISDIYRIGGVTYHPGDANRDGLVNLEDFGLLKDNFGMTAGALWTQGDFNNDGAINLEDFGILKDHFGHSSGDSPMTAIPEPASLSLLAPGLLALRRRRQ